MRVPAPLEGDQPDNKANGARPILGRAPSCVRRLDAAPLLLVSPHAEAWQRVRRARCVDHHHAARTPTCRQRPPLAAWRPRVAAGLYDRPVRRHCRRLRGIDPLGHHRLLFPHDRTAAGEAWTGGSSVRAGVGAVRPAAGGRRFGVLAAGRDRDRVVTRREPEPHVDGVSGLLDPVHGPVQSVGVVPGLVRALRYVMDEPVQCPAQTQWWSRVLEPSECLGQVLCRWATSAA
jgi:hypothetical protein